MSAEKTSMHMDPYERAWLIISFVLIVVFFIAVSIAGFSMGIQLPAPEQRVDPNTIAKEGPWADPGLRELSEGKYEAYIRLQAWAFVPNEITVPEGSEVTFYLASQDVQHGFKLEGTNLNVMVLPGQVSTLTATFDEAGEYTFLCHEYCGTGHAIMFGTVIVEP